MTDPQTIIGTLGAPNLAVDIKPDISGRGDFVLDSSLLDGPDLLGYDASAGGGWLNIVCDVTRASYRRGSTRSQGTLTRSETGTATVVVRDTARKFDPTLNADAVHKGTPLRLRAWGYSPALKLSPEQRRNLIENPRLGTTGTGWGLWAGTGGAATGTRQTTGGPTGGPFHRIAWTTAATSIGGLTLYRDASSTRYAVTPGKPYTFSVWVRSSVARSVTARLEWYTAAGANVGSGVGAAVALTAATWTRVSVTATAPATAATVIPEAYTVTNPAVGQQLDTALAMLEQSATLGDYFDGSTASGTAEGELSHGWAGTPDAAPSTEYTWISYQARWDAVLFTGSIDDLGATYTLDDPPTVTITALDIIGTLAAYKSAGRPDPGVGGGDTLIARVNRVLAEMSLPGRVSDQSDAAGYTATLASSTLAAGWSTITAAQDAELGRVWVDRDDRLVVRARYSALSGTVWGTLSDWHGEAPFGVHCCYTDPEVRFGTELITNRAIASRRVPAVAGTTPIDAVVVQVDDAYSAARYGWAVTEQQGLELETDAQLVPWAQTLILTASEPDLRVDSVRPAPWTADAAAWRAVCLTDLGDRWIFRLHPQVGPAIDRAVGVLGVESDITPDGWAITWFTDDAPVPGVANPSGWFVLDASSLDEGDLLAPYGGMAV